MSVSDVILFISTTSRVCGPVVQFIHQNQIPAKIVRLDTDEDRKNAANGKYFQIQNVPTLLVMYTDDNIQLFAGQEKVIAWFQQIIQKRHQEESTPPPQSQHSSQEIDIISSEEEEYIPKHKKKSSLKKVKVTSSPSSKKSKKKGDRGLYDGKPNKGKKKKPIRFEDDSEDDSEDEIEYYSDENDESNSSVSGLEIGPRSLEQRTSQSGSIKDIAKKMEEDRQKQLGYKEGDLPNRM